MNRALRSARGVLPLLAAALLAGCAGSPVVPSADTARAWNVHQQLLRKLDAWQLIGRIGVQSDGQGWHATLDWSQRQARYTIRIIAPLGQGSVLLTGDGKLAVLKTSEGQVSNAVDPALLLQRELGWRVPVDALRYWVVGLPAPGRVLKRQLDASGRLAELEQTGWRIRFLDYQTYNGVDLPGRVFAENRQGQVRLVIGQWQLGAGDA